MHTSIVNKKEGSKLLLVPEGKYIAGSNRKNEGGSKFKLFLPPFYLAIHPVTYKQFLEFIKHTKHSVTNDDFWRNSGKLDCPVTDVNWFDATAYCQWAGLRLPSELEWEKGARGIDGREYPWGEEWDPEKCYNRLNIGNEETCNVVNYPLGCSPWGNYQMSGNVWEWYKDWYDCDAYNHYKNGNLKSPKTGKYRVLRGGSWDSRDAELFRVAYRFMTFPDLRFPSFGFRCAMDPSQKP